MIVLLPEFVIEKLPAVTVLPPPNASLNCSRRSSATMLRGLPRTTARAWTHSMRSPLASHLHGPGQVYAAPVATFAPLCGESTWELTNASLIAPPLSRIRVVQVVLAATSTLVKFAYAEPPALAEASVRGSGQNATISAE